MFFFKLVQSHETFSPNGHTFGSYVGRMREKKFKLQPSVNKFVANISWDIVEMSVEFLNRSATIHSERYMQTSKFIQKIWRFLPNSKINQALIFPILDPLTSISLVPWTTHSEDLSGGGWGAEIEHVWRALTLQQSFRQTAYSVSRKGGKMCW
jgi:hypothetical protein